MESLRWILGLFWQKCFLDGKFQAPLFCWKHLNCSSVNVEADSSGHATSRPSVTSSVALPKVLPSIWHHGLRIHTESHTFHCLKIGTLYFWSTEINKLAFIVESRNLRSLIVAKLKTKMRFQVNKIGPINYAFFIYNSGDTYQWLVSFFVCSELSFMCFSNKYTWFNSNTL